MLVRAVVVAVVAVALSGCAGTSCDDLPDLRTERDAAREAQLERVRSVTSGADETAAGDEAVHALERQVHDLEQSCEG